MSPAERRRTLALKPMEPAWIELNARISAILGEPPDERLCTAYLQELEPDLGKVAPPSDRVFDAIRALGTGALFPAAPDDENPEPEDRLQLIASIRAHVGRQITSWCNAARDRNRARSRDEAREALNKLGRVLAGDARGRKGNDLDAFEVRLIYYRYRIGLKNGVALLRRGAPRPRTREVLEQVATRSLLDSKLFADRFRFSDPTESEGHRTALGWTAEDFDVAAHSVEKIVSAGRINARKAGLRVSSKKLSPK